MGIEDRYANKMDREREKDALKQNPAVLMQRKNRESKIASTKILEGLNERLHFKDSTQVMDNMKISFYEYLNVDAFPEATDENIEGMLAEMTRYFANRKAEFDGIPTESFKCPQFLKEAITIDALQRIIYELRITYWSYLISKQTGNESKTPDGYEEYETDKQVAHLHENTFACLLAGHPDISRVAMSTAFEDDKEKTDIKAQLKNTTLAKNRRSSTDFDIRIDVTSDTSVALSKKNKRAERDAVAISRGSRKTPYVILQYDPDTMPIVTLSLIHGIGSDFDFTINKDNIFPSKERIKKYLKAFFERELHNQFLSEDNLLKDLEQRISSAIKVYLRPKGSFSESDKAETLARIARLMGESQ